MIERAKTALARISPALDAEDIRDALRAALQTSVAAVATYLAMRVVGMDAYFIGVLAAIFILQPSIGGTVEAGMQRITATLIGSLIGIGCLIALPAGWGTVFALGLSLFVIGGLSRLKPAWAYGAVAAVALSFEAEQNAVQVAMDRGWAILIGALIGTVTTFAVWPQTAAQRFSGHLGAAQRAIARHTTATLDRALGAEQEEAIAADEAYQDRMRRARESADAIRLDRETNREDRIASTERLYNSLTIIDRAVDRADDAPLSETEEFETEVQTMREATVKILEILRGTETGDAQAAFEELNKSLEDAKQSLSDDDPTAPGHRRRAALIFGMEELRDALFDLFDELDRVETRSIARTAMDATGVSRMLPTKSG